MISEKEFIVCRTVYFNRSCYIPRCLSSSLEESSSDEESLVLDGAYNDPEGASLEPSEPSSSDESSEVESIMGRVDPVI